MSIVVESNIPAPTGRSGYPFAAMDVGDSFMIKTEDAVASKKSATAIGASARNFGKKHPSKFTVRLVDGGVRCWRVE
jgi:hypothetical protein